MIYRLVTAFEYASLIHKYSGYCGRYSMIQPDSEFTAAHEFFAILIKFFVMGQIEIINKIYKFLLFYES